MHYVMSKDGDLITRYIYNDTSSYSIAYILSVFLNQIYDMDRCHLILSQDCEQNGYRYKDIYDVLQRVGIYGTYIGNKNTALSIRKAIEPMITDESYYILYACDTCIKYHDPTDDKFVPAATDYDKVRRSLLFLTENFKNDPIQASVRFYFVRFAYIRGFNTKTCKDILNIYWIYAFSDENTLEAYIDSIPFEKIDIGKIFTYADMQDKSFDSLQSMVKIASKYLKKHYEERIRILERELEEQNEKYQKEIEDLISPDGGAYQVTKERFEKMQKETREDARGETREKIQKDGLD